MKNLCVSMPVAQVHQELKEAKFLVKGRDVQTTNPALKTGCLFAVKGTTVYEFSLSENYCRPLYDLNTHYQGEDVETPEVVGFSYNFIHDLLVVCTSAGDVLSLTADYGEFQDVTHVSARIQAMEWSFDQEWYTLIASDQKVVILMSGSLDHFNYLDLTEKSEEEQEQQNVGWGKKETQFHGSEGKSRALAGKAPSLQHPHLTQTTVTWRADSALFAVSYWSKVDNARRIKIFNRDGVLQNIAQDLPGLEDTLSWRPSGNLIAFTQASQENSVVSFLEKNGLKHGEFELPKNIKVHKLLWNADSSILSAICTDIETLEESLILWTIGNYHWYLKQKISFKTKLSCVLWDETRGNRLHGICEDGTCFTIEFMWTVNHSEGFENCDPAYVGVIDNDKILVTSFKEAIIPPPMCHWTLECPSSVNKLIFPSYKSGESNFIGALLHNEQFAIFSNNSGTPELNKLCNIVWEKEHPLLVPTYLCHWIWVTPEALIMCGPDQNNATALCFMQLVDDKIIVKDIQPLYGVAISISSCLEELLLQTSDGKLHLYNVQDHSNSLHKIYLPEPCYKMQYNSLGIYSLSELNRFYLNGKQIASNVTSFLIHKPYILATTTLHCLLVLNGNEELSSRKLERGSRLVIASGNSAVMQMPRGNLETIQPRALTVLSAGQLLDDKKYQEAMTLLRRQRIDLNLCVDHNPQQFIEDAELFVEQVDPQWITLLITELSDDDVTKGPYAAYYSQKQQGYKLEDKIKEVCLALRNAMNASPKLKLFTLAVLSSLVKTKDMDQAIELANTDEALKHLLFLVDVDKLYTDALAAYNLEAALRIAGKSQQDPKEYVPYLNSLRNMDPSYMKYTIDMKLRKYESALVNIAQCEGDDKFQECFKLIKDHSLYAKALEIFKSSEDRYKIIASIYGEYLFKKQCYEEAGLMYIRSGDNEKAMQAYKETGNWKKCMTLAKKLNLSDDALRQIADSLCSSLKSLQQYSAAATIYLQFLSDIEQAVESYVLGKLWTDAVYVAESHSCPQLIDKNIKKALIETYEGLMEDLTNKISQIEKYSARLFVVRHEKLLKLENPDMDDMSDTQSETSSASSFRSSMSRSTKNTRKAQRKMWSLKEGNPREEQALVSTLSQLIQSSEKLTGEVRTTCLALLTFQQDEEAKILQNKMKSTLQCVEKYKAVIWPMVNKETNGEVDVLDQQLSIRPATCILVGWQVSILKQDKS